MKNIIIIITFLPWLGFYFTYCNIAVKELKKKPLNLKYVKENFYRIFRIETLLLMSIFIYFTTYNNMMVNKMLFSVINLFLFINLFYDNRYQNINKINGFNIFIVIPLLIVSLIPFIIYLVNDELTILYYLLFSFGFFAYIIIYLCQIVAKYTKKVFKH